MPLSAYRAQVDSHLLVFDLFGKPSPCTGLCFARLLDDLSAERCDLERALVLGGARVTRLRINALTAGGIDARTVNALSHLYDGLIIPDRHADLVARLSSLADIPVYLASARTEQEIHRFPECTDDEAPTAGA